MQKKHLIWTWRPRASYLLKYYDFESNNSPSETVTHRFWYSSNWNKGSLQNKFSVKVGILSQPAWPPPLPERWDFFREFVENFRQNRVKYALKTVT